MKPSMLRAATPPLSDWALARNVLLTLVAHSVLLGALLGLLGYGGPALAVLVLQAEFELPAVVEASLKLPGWIRSYGNLFAGPAVAVALAVDLGVYGWLRIKVGETAGLVWSYFILIGQGAFLGWMAVCYCWPFYLLFQHSEQTS